MDNIFLLASDSSSIFFNLLTIFLFSLIYKKSKRYIPLLCFILYIFILVFWRVNYHEAYSLNKLISIILFILYISQKDTRHLNLKSQKYIYLASLALLMPYIGILNLYNSSFLNQTFFVFATLAFVLLYNALFVSNRKFLIILMFIVNITALAKWLIIYYLKSILYFLKSRKFTFRIFFRGIALLVIVYYVLNMSIRYAGYESIDTFILRRVTKLEALNYEQQHILGISDGNRINIALAQFSDFINSRDIFGLGFDYTNIYEVYEHNIFVFLITRFGIVGILLSVIFIYRFIISFNRNKYLAFFYLHIMLTFLIGEYYGSPIAMYAIILTLYLLTINQDLKGA